jgi:hypothetical protein
MTWKLKKEGEGMTPIAGVPWRDMEDAEFKAVSDEYDKQFPDQPGSLKKWFEHEKTKKGGE